MFSFLAFLPFRINCRSSSGSSLYGLPPGVFAGLPRDRSSYGYYSSWWDLGELPVKGGPGDSCDVLLLPMVVYQAVIPEVGDGSGGRGNKVPLPSEQHISDYGYTRCKYERSAEAWS